MKKVIVCVNYRANPNQPSCAARGSEQLAKILEAEIQQRGLPAYVERFICFGLCNDGPNLRLAPNGPFISGASQQNLPDILAKIEEFSKQV
ncbi:MAG TPA: (2Fe-2S) ferredoxin domain-containing protein [Methylophilaceae bacterium]|nr:(2Fe-2S) ferredoxin domain-containing protein [Methylophilaceae bacterium]